MHPSAHHIGLAFLSARWRTALTVFWNLLTCKRGGTSRKVEREFTRSWRIARRLELARLKNHIVPHRFLNQPALIGLSRQRTLLTLKNPTTCRKRFAVMRQDLSKIQRILNQNPIFAGSRTMILCTVDFVAASDGTKCCHVVRPLQHRRFNWTFLTSVALSHHISCSLQPSDAVSLFVDSKSSQSTAASHPPHRCILPSCRPE
jgi:hypothetical protein